MVKQGVKTVSMMQLFQKGFGKKFKAIMSSEVVLPVKLRTELSGFRLKTSL